MSINILITGLPHSGKTTLLERLVMPVEYKQGFLTQEVQEDSKRTGFEIITASGIRTLLASTHLSTPYKVSRYCVDVDASDAVLPPLFTFTTREVLYIDEIGQMELYSKNFERLVVSYLEAPNLFLGTFSQVFSNAFTDSLKNRKDIEVVEITLENREDVYTQLKRRIS